MRSWFVLASTEWRIFVRGPLVWLFLLLGAGHALLVHNSASWSQNIAYYLHQFEFMYVGVLGVLAVILGIYAARRDKSVGIDKLIGSQPYSSGQQQSARFAVYSVPFIGLSLVPVALFVWFKITRFPEAEWYPALYLAATAFPMIYALALGWAIGTWIKSRIGYMLGFFIYFVHIYVGMLIIAPNLPVSVRLIPNFLLFDFKSMGYFDDLFGFSHDASFWYHRVFYALIGIGLIGLTVVSAARIRKEWFVRRSATVPILCAIAAFLAMYAHIQAKNEQALHLSPAMPAMSAMPDRPDPSQQSEMQSSISGNSPYVSAYKISISYESGEKLVMHAEMKVQTDAGIAGGSNRRLEFLLNGQLRVSEITIEGKEALFEQSGNKVRLELPEISADNQGDRERTIGMNYEGKVSEFILTHDGILFPIHFANRYQVNLRAASNWYPRLDNPKPSLFTLSVTYPSTIRLFSNLDTVSRSENGNKQSIRYEGLSGGLNLWGGPLIEVIKESNGIRTTAIVNELTDKSYTARIVAYYHEARLLFNRLSGVPATEPSVTMVASDWIHAGYLKDYVAADGVVDITSYIFSGLYTDEEAVSRSIPQLIRSSSLFAKPLSPTNEFILKTAIAAYLIKQTNDKPYSMPWEDAQEFDTSAVQPLLDSIAKETREHSEALIRALVDALQSDPQSKLDVAGILSNKAVNR